MQWRGRRGSSNVEDQRGRSSPGGGFPGGFGRRPGGFPGQGFPGGGRRISLPRSKAGWVVFLVVIGISIFAAQQERSVGPGGAGGSGGALIQADREAGQFASVVLADTEEVWARRFQDELGRRYDPPTLVLFSGSVRSGCGGASAASGPFYCPLDEKAYLDTDFFDALERRLGARGDFAAAYVIAHEVGHHVQNELGMLERAQAMKAGLDEAGANAVQVKVELMADCLAGVWAREAQRMFGSLDEGDVDEALNAASRIGDDTLQREAGRTVRPETFQHGTSADRKAWFATGWNEATIAACDTF
ncbi:KPN_02809 family neutral zinc metallopeptidase [Albimonas pacifica]|uniref:Neutral zinc metallopeptidase n=1 Tax=Albimonas pacifica TaxID=1114924 RepID=A0A1I3GNJ0_9RHOB|nr:neutral zinc metallopeptidase [Albimonas pacifica]SFI24852.1 hypothetical protein SAMN05216258_105251 [Albimonas pacifica]